MSDIFVGTWILNVEKSEFDANHQPKAATMIVSLDAEGNYVQQAQGLNSKGEKVIERTQRLVPDGREHPIEDVPGLKIKTIRLDLLTMTTEASREDGTVVGGGTTVIAPDGQTKTVTNFGMDAQLRPFQMRTVWDRAAD